MSQAKTSRITGLYQLSIKERLDRLSQAAGLDPSQLQVFDGSHGLQPEQADKMVENALGVFGLPLGIATNFIINDREVLIPMAIEEPSVVAGASYMAKITRNSGGFAAKASAAEMIAQIQLLDVPDMDAAIKRIQEQKQSLLSMADAVDAVLLKVGGGARDIELRVLESTPIGPMLIVHLIIDTRDAMGANVVNTAAERLTPILEKLSGGRAHLRILSNLADRRLARAECRIPCEALAFDGFDGSTVRDGIIAAWAFAAADPYRAATHNKGIMNGVDAVLIATGNDWRAVEAGAHAYAVREGRYTSLSRWSTDEEGALLGELEMPMAVGIVGGATRVHPAAKAALALMDVTSAAELAEIITAVGLAQNMAALRALATEGIQRGHMALHARQVAIAAGAEGQEIDEIAKQMVADQQVRVDHAQKLLQLKDQQ